MTVHRYSLAKGSELTDDENGNLVAYVYYAEIATQLTEAQARIASLEAELAAAASRNAELEAAAVTIGHAVDSVLPKPEKTPLEQIVEEFIERAREEPRRETPTPGARNP